MKSGAISAHEIADYFIDFFHVHGDYITNLKLQKLLYYAQAWYLALHGSSLFEEEIEAWIHGPVVPSVYRKFKHWGFKPINYVPSNIKLTQKIKNHLQEVIDVYGGYAAFELEKLTHESEPWIKARGNKQFDEPSDEIINKENMKSYYAKMVKENENTR